VCVVCVCVCDVCVCMCVVCVCVCCACVCVCVCDGIKVNLSKDSEGARKFHSVLE